MNLHGAFRLSVHFYIVQPYIYTVCSLVLILSLGTESVNETINFSCRGGVIDVV